LTAERSASDSLSGPALHIGGWLVLIAFGLIVSVGGNLLNCWKLFQFLTAAPSIKGGIGLAVVMLEVFIQLFMLCASVVLVALFFFRKRTFKPLFIAYIASLFCLGLTSVALTASVPGVSAEVVGQAMTFPIYVFLLGAVWVPYFLISKRVKSTFVF